ncbi:MAG: response regulator [Prevotellaceae bacterium]|nr:response regulator [Prevotellaceae bacterium]
MKRLTEVHHGEISLDSKPGVGSVFTVLLNVSDDAFPQSSYISDDKVIVPISEYKFSQSMKGLADDIATNEKVSELTKGKMNLLIVDDNEDLLSFLANYFSHKYNVITAHNGAEALEKARTENIQLIVSDIMMPEMDGIELCKTLKGDMQTSHIPVILLTAKSEPDDVVEGYKSGAEAYVSKPFEPQILELQIKNIISLLQVRQMEIANSQEAENEATTSTLTIIDRKFIKDINDLVEANIGNSDFAIIDITQHLGVSRSLLHAKMRSLMNMSMGDYIRKKRLDYACQLLRETHSVAETAYKSGFADPNYFSKVFKKFMGVSPTEYINQ